ncbi:MAG: calcium-binding protein [Microcystis aeruginosa Ma_QC_Ca_00000000_S207]|uniref:Calcium-binding protein n=1 Tax=Microcystis aeruginosa Ma_QC_Ca_00000000_S207 TaxID=2486251 RepID=A0A552FBD8_MICAE|nr:MAG: calcium-binding protein [Microcystis aeruginosa Ma_QC_Ca_00000000_S207]
MAISQEVYASLNILYASQAPSASDISLWQTDPSLTSLTWEETVLVFANSAAAQQTYPLLAAPGAATDATRRQYVLEVFNNAYGLQEADLDPAEIDYWVEWLSLTNPDGSPADSDGNGIPNILDFPIVLNQYQPPEIQRALLNRAEVALDFAAQFQLQGISSFTEEDYNTSWSILETVTAQEASVTAALAANLEAAVAAGGAGNSVALTAGQDDLTANLFLAAPVNNFGQVNQTLNSGDKLTGSGTNPTLTVLWTGAIESVLPTFTDVETLNVTNTGTGLLTVLGASVTGLKNVNVADSIQNFSLTNTQTAVETVSLSRTNADTTITIANAALAGDEDAVTLTLNQAGIATDNALLTLNPVSGTDGYEQLAIATEGLASTVALTAVGIEEVTITGDQNLTLTNALVNTATKLDASEFEGNLSVISGTGTIDFTGGLGDDTFLVQAFNGADIVDGGEGTNTLVVTAANAEGITAEDDNITNIQTLALFFPGSAGATLRADFIGDEITAVDLENGTFGAYTVRFNAGDNTLTTFDNTGALNVQAEGTATTDALTLNIDGTAGVNDVTVASLTLNNVDRPIEQLTINSTDALTGHTIAGAVTLPTTVGVNNAITITGNSNLTIGGAVTADEIDASGMTNGAGLTMFPGSTSTIAISITGSGGDDRLVGSTFRDSISGAGGNDNITGGTGTDRLTGGDGRNTFVQTTADSAIASATNGVAGTAFTAAQTITFAPVGTSAVPNVDIISGFTGGVNGDILDLGSATAAVSGIGTANNALAAGTNYFLSGNFTTGTGVFTITSDGGGADTLIIQGFAGFGTNIATNTSSIVLVGFNSNNLVGANII